MAEQKKFKKRGSTRSLLLILLVLIALAVALIMWPTESKAATYIQGPDDLETTTLINAGDVAPDFEVEMLDGSKVKLSQLKGKVVMVCFWATWCPPCRQEMAHMQEGVVDVFAGEDFVLLPISRGEKRETVESFIDKMGYTFPIGLDEDQSIYKKYATNYIPRTFIVGKDGVVAYRAIGYDEEVANEVHEAIVKALK